MNTNLITFEELQGCTKKDIKEINTLIHQKHKCIQLSVRNLTNCIIGSHVIVARCNDNIIGTILLIPLYTLLSTAGYFDNLMVSCLFTGISLHQIRQALITEVIEKSKKMHLDYVTISVAITNTQDRTFLISKGFDVLNGTQMILQLK